MSYHTSIWDKIDIFSYHEPGKNRLKAKIHIFYQSSHTLENMLFLLILGPGIQWCRPFLRATNIFEEKFKMAAKRVVFLIRKGFTLIREPFQSKMVSCMVRTTKWACRIFYFAENSKMAAKIVSFCRFFTFERVLYSYGSLLLHRCWSLWPNLRKVQGRCVTFEKNSRWPPKSADFVVFFPFEKCFTHIWELIFATDVHQEDWIRSKISKTH